MKNLNVIIFGILTLALVNGCNSDKAIASAEIKDTLVYPYYASSERKQEIMNGSKKLVIGMPKKEVVKLMGEPDEVSNIYNTLASMEKKQPSGYSYIYLIQRKKKLGSFIERQEVLFKLHFNLNDVLTKTTREGIR